MNIAETKILYWAIALFSFFLAALSQRRSNNGTLSFKALPFIFSFVVPCFFFAFTDISNDYEEYCYIFEISELSNFNSLWVEPGYALLNAVIKLFTHVSSTAISIIKIIELSIVYFVIYDNRKQINIGLSVWAFLSLSYLDSFCMLRINLAAAIILLALDIYENKNNKLLALALYIIACTIHYSAVMLIAPIATFIICSRKSEFKFSYILILLLVLVFVRVVANTLMENVLNSYAVLNKYSVKYGITQANGSGLMQYVFHLPFAILFVWYWSRVKSGITGKDDMVFKLTVAFAPFSLFYGTMGYSVEVIGRSFVYFNYLWIIGMPCFYQQIQNNQKRRQIYIIVFLWLLYRLYLYINDALVPAGIQSYHLTF